MLDDQAHRARAGGLEPGRRAPRSRVGSSDRLREREDVVRRGLRRRPQRHRRAPEHARGALGRGRVDGRQDHDPRIRDALRGVPGLQRLRRQRGGRQRFADPASIGPDLRRSAHALSPDAALVLVLEPRLRNRFEQYLQGQHVRRRDHGRDRAGRLRPVARRRDGDLFQPSRMLRRQSGRRDQPGRRPSAGGRRHVHVRVPGARAGRAQRTRLFPELRVDPGQHAASSCRCSRRAASRRSSTRTRSRGSPWSARRMPVPTAGRRAPLFKLAPGLCLLAKAAEQSAGDADGQRRRDVHHDQRSPRLAFVSAEDAAAAHLQGRADERPGPADRERFHDGRDDDRRRLQRRGPDGADAERSLSRHGPIAGHARSVRTDGIGDRAEPLAERPGLQANLRGVHVPAGSAGGLHRSDDGIHDAGHRFRSRRPRCRGRSPQSSTGGRRPTRQRCRTRWSCRPPCGSTPAPTST